MVSVPTSQELDKWLSSHATELAGAAIAVISSDGQQEMATFGRLDIRENKQVAPSTLFMLGSTAKVITALLICQLVEDGKLSLDDSIVKVLPESKAIFPDHDTQASIRHLLSHSSGLVDFFEPVTDQSDLITKLTRYQILSKPGQLISYSNAGYMILGALLERVTGSSWATLVISKLKGPLQLHSTVLGASDEESTSKIEDLDLVAEDHIIGADGKLQRQMMWPRFQGLFAAAGTTAAASIEDAATLFSTILWGEYRGTAALKPSTCKEMQRIQQPLPGPSTFCEGWGLGWGVIDANSGLVGHMGGSSTFVMGSSEMGKAVVFLSNTANGAKIGRALAFRALGLTDPRSPASLPRSIPYSGNGAEYVGRYGTPLLYCDVAVSTKDPTALSVVNSIDSTFTIDLAHISGHTYLGNFQGLPTEFTFLRDGDHKSGVVKYLHVGLRAMTRMLDGEVHVVQTH